MPNPICRVWCEKGWASGRREGQVQGNSFHIFPECVNPKICFFSKVIEAEVVQVSDPLSKTKLSPNGSKAEESSYGRKQSKPSTNASQESQMIKPEKFILATSGADDKDKVIDF